MRFYRSSPEDAYLTRRTTPHSPIDPFPEPASAPGTCEPLFPSQHLAISCRIHARSCPVDTNPLFIAKLLRYCGPRVSTTWTVFAFVARTRNICVESAKALLANGQPRTFPNRQRASLPKHFSNLLRRCCFNSAQISTLTEARAALTCISLVRYFAHASKVHTCLGIDVFQRSLCLRQEQSLTGTSMGRPTPSSSSEEGAFDPGISEHCTAGEQLADNLLTGFFKAVCVGSQAIKVFHAKCSSCAGSRLVHCLPALACVLGETRLPRSKTRRAVHIPATDARGNYLPKAEIAILRRCCLLSNHWRHHAHSKIVTALTAEDC